ncbi:tetratricopeptide repeat protein [Synechocystis sp. B12]|nr:tetratricopeptide repeat protein [Synechocystis sp. B12]
MTVNLEQIKILISVGDYPEALTLLENCVEQEPIMDHYWYLGLIHLFNDDLDSAQEAWLTPLLLSTVENTPQLFESLLSFLTDWIEICITQSKLSKAILIYESILTLEPKYENHKIQEQLANQLGKMASLLCLKKQYKQAIPLYQQALELNPKKKSIGILLPGPIIMLSIIKKQRKQFAKLLLYVLGMLLTIMFRGWYYRS